MVGRARSVGSSPAQHNTRVRACARPQQQSSRPPPRPLPQVPANKQDQNYQHTLIHIYLLKRRKVPLGEEGAAGEAAGDAAGEETAEGAAEGAAGVAAEGAAEDAGDGEAEAAGAAQRVAMAAGGSLGEAAAAASEAAAGAGAASDAGAAPAGEAEAAQRSSELFQARRQGNALVRALAEVQL